MSVNMLIKNWIKHSYNKSQSFAINKNYYKILILINNCVNNTVNKTSNLLIKSY